MRNIRSFVVLTLIWSAALGMVTAGPPVETAMIRISGGVELATDIYHPATEPAPVILIRTPYGRTGHDFLGEGFSAQGYATVIQDVRGKYDSGGEHEPFRHDRVDGLATLKWIATQSWSNGRISMWGIGERACSPGQADRDRGSGRGDGVR